MHGESTPTYKLMLICVAPRRWFLSRFCQEMGRDFLFRARVRLHRFPTVLIFYMQSLSLVNGLIAK